MKEGVIMFGVRQCPVNIVERFLEIAVEQIKAFGGKPYGEVDAIAWRIVSLSNPSSTSSSSARHRFTMSWATDCCVLPVAFW